MHACHGHRYWPSLVSLSGTGQKGGGGGGCKPALAGTREYKQSDQNRWRVVEVLWNLECPVGLRQKRNVCILMKEVWHNLDGPSKNKELWSYIMNFELVGRE